MIIGYFHVKGISVFKAETDPPLVINPDAPLPGPVTLQRLKMV